MISKWFFALINWENVLLNTYPERIKKLNKLVKMSQKGVRFNCIRKYINLTRQLRNYIGSIKKETPENAIRVKEKELRTHIYSYSGRPEANKRIEEYNKSLQRNLRQTTEYKEAKSDITKLKEKLEERKEKEDKRLKFLDKFKKRIAKTFIKLIGDLNEFNNKTND